MVRFVQFSILLVELAKYCTLFNRQSMQATTLNVGISNRFAC